MRSGYSERSTRVITRKNLGRMCVACLTAFLFSIPAIAAEKPINKENTAKESQAKSVNAAPENKLKVAPSPVVNVTQEVDPELVLMTAAVKRALAENNLLKDTLEKDGLLEKAVKAVLDKKKIFQVKGQSEVNATADYANFMIYITGDTINVSQENKAAGELSAINTIDTKIDMFKRKMERAYNKEKIEFNFKKEGLPLIQFATGIKEFAMLKPTIKCYFVATQKVAMFTKGREVEGIMKSVMLNGASFAPSNARFLDVMVDKIHYGKDVVVTGMDPRTQKWQVDIVPVPAVPVPAGAAKTAKPEDSIAFTVSDEKRKKYEQEALNLAFEDAKAKALVTSKQIGVSIEKIVPVVEQSITSHSVNDKTGTIIFNAEVTLYY